MTDNDMLEWTEFYEIMSNNQLTDGRGKTCLYVGVNPSRQFLLPDILGMNYKTDIMEIHGPNVVWAQKNLKNINNIHHMDIRSISSAMYYDLIFWMHGPEHLPFDDFYNTLIKLEKQCQFLLLGCPCGHSPQGPIRDNKWEEHLWDVYPAHFDALGYDVKQFYRGDGITDGIFAWRRRNNEQI